MLYNEKNRVKVLEFEIFFKMMTNNKLMNKKMYISLCNVYYYIKNILSHLF